MIADRIKDMRQAHGYSQVDLARILGVSQNTISSYESGRMDPGLPSLIKLAVLFGVTTDYLLGVDIKPPERDAQLYDRIRALPPDDKVVADKLITALADRNKIHRQPSTDGSDDSIKATANGDN